MTNTLLQLQKKLPDDFLQIFRQVSIATSNLGIGSFVIGATARDLIFEYVYDAKIRRLTEDIDFGFAVGSWAEYEKLWSVLIGSGKFRDDLQQKQRIWWIGGSSEMRVDLVPFGGLELQTGQIDFPPEGDFAMSTLGFREAADNLLTLQLTDDFAINVVSLPGLALLKTVAYNERPGERRRDVQDIWFIAQNYMSAVDNDRLYDADSEDFDLVDEENFDYRTVGARLLGRDIARLLNNETRKIIDNILGEQSDGGRFADVISRDGLRDDGDYDQILITLRELRRGIEERS